MWKKQCFHVRKTYWYFLLITKINEVLLTPCSVSVPTLQMVSKCPTTEEEVRNAIKRKDCDSLAEVQKCTKPKNFKYHCVINVWKNETYEVCVPAIYSQGRCLEFNRHGKVLQELRTIDCGNMGCPKRFYSADIKSYDVCYKLVKQVSNSKPSDWNATSISLASICGMLFLLLVLVTCLLLRKQNTKNTGTEHRKSEEVGLISEERERAEILNGEEFTNDAIQKITEDYDSRKRIKRKAKISQNTKRLTDSTLSIKSSESHVTIKQGFDVKTFTFFLKRHNLQDCKEILYRNKIDCLQTFFELDESKLALFGLEYGQVLKCVRAKKSILTETRV